MIFFTFGILIIYIVLVLLFIKGWKKIPTFDFRDYTSDIPAISVVVACKNEEKNLSNLLHSLKNQSISNFQLVIIDDNSDDNTWQIMQNARHDFNQLLTLKSVENGKKKALKLGIEQAKNELIVLTDADCTPSPFWLENIAKFQNHTNSDLIIGAVTISPANNFFEKIQQLELRSLISSGAGMAGLNNPIMCNGANLAIKRSSWLANYANIKDNINSGDDVFMLHALKKENMKIRFLKSQESIVHTTPSISVAKFMHQRTRWASKAPSYSDFSTLLIALIIFSISILQLILLVLGLYNVNFTQYYLILTTSKLIIDLIFLSQTSKFFEQKITAKTVIPLAVIYPFYIAISSISGLLKSIRNYR